MKSRNVSANNSEMMQEGTSVGEGGQTPGTLREIEREREALMGY